MSENGHPEEVLTRRQEALISALLTQPSITAAAKAAKVPETTARRWLKQAAFLRAYRAARRQQVEQSTATIQAATSTAVATLLRNMKDTVPEAVQVRAALGILEHATKAVELVDLIERVEALEHALTTSLQQQQQAGTGAGGGFRRVS